MEASFLIVVGGGGVAPLDAIVEAASCSPRPIVIAADSGVDACMAAAVVPHHVVGDFDSADPEALLAAERAGAEIHRHEADKDATDIELAIHLAGTLAAGGSGSVRVVGGGAGRLDHALADLLLLGGSALQGRRVTARFGSAEVDVVRPGLDVEIEADSGVQVSLVPLHGRARGVSTSGLRWALADADLDAGTTRAISNEFVGGPATVTVGEGVLAVIRPGTVAPAIAPRATQYDPTPRSPS